MQARFSSNILVVYGPRDEHKLEIVEELLLASHGHVLKVSA